MRGRFIIFADGSEGGSIGAFLPCGMGCWNEFGKVGKEKVKLYHYTMLFMILFLGIASMLYAQGRIRSRREWERQKVERSVDLAVDAAAGYMATHSDGRLHIDKDEVLEVFFCNLYAALGALDRIPEQERLRGYVSCVVIVDVDGYFLWHEKKNDVGSVSAMWEEKVFFGAGKREAMLEKAVLAAVRGQAQERGFLEGEYRLELPDREGLIKRGMEERGVLVMLRGIPEHGYMGTFEYFAFSGTSLYKIKR